MPLPCPSDKPKYEPDDRSLLVCSTKCGCTGKEFKEIRGQTNFILCMYTRLDKSNLVPAVWKNKMLEQCE